MKFFASVLLVTGCSVFDSGKDNSTLHIEHSCDVSLDQAATTRGDDQSKVIEAVTIEPDCTTEIDFKQNVGE